MTAESPETAGRAGIGRARQNAVYRAGVLGHRPGVPTDADALERRARRVMSREAWAYVAGGAGSGATMQHNREAFARHRVVPRVLHGVVERDLGTTLLGVRHRSPLLVAPVGAADLVRPDADVLIAEGADAAGVGYVFSNQGGSPMERTATAMGSTPFWYQLYWSSDKDLVDSLIGRAEACGAGALVVTLDTTVLGWRPQDLDLGSLPFARGLGLAQYTSDPRFTALVRERLAGTPGAAARTPVTLGALRSLWSISRHHPGRLLDNLRSAEPRAAVQAFLDVYSNPGLSWDHLATLRDRTTLPVLLKGVLHPDDARRALDLGVDGLVVSNHGGRQVDRAVASLDALVAIRAAVGPQPTLLLDSGIRTGTDVLVGLALGADACLVGRPHLYGLALAGADGVRQVLENLLAELELTMALTGAPDLAAVTPELLAP
ncbi:alpha-hydroxy-acid oxidizing protein [Microlunatus capsulatus]|uniref:Isopentenyl diphosphate isomerase/L-lactate dehydrogenase-like FMN-dependent dehydrogenase n=1 Tax=Microlunatus capsulatus TaxID=99117 RepID=A0ABS4Z708_9ACTN|nr:alpha-hydroxy-acid oxidizing protein [Microlunatus capsulatus]MBP2416828.1 isopentenyl diphosphate isomerase/L-lactate dehydrogenase-like FMN-dependent dehydrogenase [Microlunatus capsulatus]